MTSKHGNKSTLSIRISTEERGLLEEVSRREDRKMTTVLMRALRAYAGRPVEDRLKVELARVNEGDRAAAKLGNEVPLQSKKSVEGKGEEKTPLHPLCDGRCMDGKFGPWHKRVCPKWRAA